MLGACVLVPMVVAVSMAWACAPGGVGIPPPSPSPSTSFPSVAVEPASGFAGSTARVTGRSFPPEPVEIRWDSTGGPLLAHVSGPDFSTPVTIPNTPGGDHTIVVFTRNTNGAPLQRVSASFRVVAPPPGAPAPSGAAALAPEERRAPGFPASPPDTEGPAIAGAELTKKNGVRTVSRNGEVWVFCGVFAEESVSGICGARSARPVGQLKTSRRGSAARRALLKLGARGFQAEPGRPVLLRFVLTKSSMKMLRAAGKVRMRGSVEARDPSGNATTASFGLTLKAPTARGR